MIERAPQAQARLASRPTAPCARPHFVPFLDAKGATSQRKGAHFNPHSNPSTHKTRRAQLSFRRYGGAPPKAKRASRCTALEVRRAPCAKRAASQADQTVRPHMLELGALTPSSAGMSLRPPQKACTTPVREDDDFRCDDGRLPHLTGFEEEGLPACQSRCEEEHECAFVSYWINSKWCSLTSSCDTLREAGNGPISVYSCFPPPPTQPPPLSPGTCTNHRTEWMADNGYDCSWTFGLENYCNREPLWVADRICQKVCANGATGLALALLCGSWSAPLGVGDLGF